MKTQGSCFARLCLLLFLTGSVVMLGACGEGVSDSAVAENEQIAAIPSNPVETTTLSDTPVVFDRLVLRSGESLSVAQNLKSEWVFELISKPRGITVELRAEGAELRITAPANFIGSDSFQYRVISGVASSELPVSVTLDSESPDVETSSQAKQVVVTVYSEAESSDSVTLKSTSPQFLLPTLGLRPSELAVIINSDDPDSSALAKAYAKQRGIPPENVITLSLGKQSVISQADFSPLMSQLLAQIPSRIQAYALMFSLPYRVDCMSITTAFGFGGFDTKFCNRTAGACSVTASSPYFNGAASTRFAEHSVRPAMMVTGKTIEAASLLIQRGALADNSFPPGRAYFLRTTDSARNVRWPIFERTAQNWNESGALSSLYIDTETGGGSDLLTGVDDVLFYLTGLTRVDDLDTLVFRPGAVADHLTSAGGRIDSISGQMNVLEWLQAGATASYGTVVEPCAYTQKFPRSDILLDYYYRGDTVVEAYWKSVQWPGEGVFVGEPLAQPWGRKTLTYKQGTLMLTTTELRPGQTYTVSASDTVDGDFQPVSAIKIDTWGLTDIVIENADKAFYRLQ